MSYNVPYVAEVDARLRLEFKPLTVQHALGC
jgi:hypothetical protein